MDSNELAKRVLNTLAQAAAITEPQLIINGQAYNAAQLQALFDAGSMPDAWQAAASQFTRQVRSGSKSLFVGVRETNWEGETLATFDLIAPADYEAYIIKIVHKDMDHDQF